METTSRVHEPESGFRELQLADSKVTPSGLKDADCIKLVIKYIEEANPFNAEKFAGYIVDAQLKQTYTAAVMHEYDQHYIRQIKVHLRDRDLAQAQCCLEKIRNIDLRAVWISQVEVYLQNPL